MTVKALAERCGWKILAGEKGAGAQVSGCQAGDLLSWVLAHGKPGRVWLTVMGTENAVAVAVLTGASAIVLTGGAALDEEAACRAEERGVPIYSCTQEIYETALKVYEMTQGI